MYHIHHILKTYLLGHIVLSGLVHLSPTLQAATHDLSPPTQEVYLQKGDKAQKATANLPLRLNQDLGSTHAHRKDRRYTIYNPLVLLTCAMTYQDPSDSLTTIEREMNTLYNLFKKRCGYEVKSTFFDEEGHIFPRHQENEKEMDGKWLYASKLDKWIHTQVNYVKQHGKKYDALIFIFSGHGGGDPYGNDYIWTSDYEPYPWEKVVSAFSAQLGDHFTHKPKLLWKLACRKGLEEVKIRPQQLPVDHTNLFTYYSTAAGSESSSYAAKRLTEFIASYFQRVIYQQYPLSWIIQQLKKEMANLYGYEVNPDTAGALPVQHVFFDKKKSGAFFNFPATDNLPKLPYEDKDIIPREEDLKDIFDNFLNGHIQQVLVAKRGIGKSTLAHLYARKYEGEKGYYAHVWWFNATDETTLATSIAAVNAAMGILPDAHRNMRQGMDKIEATLQTYPDWLLIFDHAQDPSKLLVNYLPKDTTRGHILITSHYEEGEVWTDHGIYPKIVAGITFREAKKKLHRFHTSQGINEEMALDQLLNSVTLLPLTLAQIGHYLYQDRQDEWSWSIRQNYLTLYRDAQEHYTAIKGVPASIVIAFTITAQKIQEKIAQENAKALKETWRILRVISFLHPDGLDRAFLAHLRPSRKDTHKWLRGWVEDKSTTIGHTQAEKAAQCLSAYGILMEKQGKYRADPTLQEIMRWRIKEKQLTSYIQDQALQLLETMQQQSPTQAASLHFEMAAHCRTLMAHVQHDPKKRTRLLRLISQIDHQACLRVP